LGGRNSTGTRDFPETHAGVSTITVTLRDRRVFTEVEVAWATEVIRVRGHATIPFTADEIADVDDTPPGWSDAEEPFFGAGDRSRRCACRQRSLGSGRSASR